MRVNIISTNRNQTGLAQDVDLIQAAWYLSFPESEFRRIHHAQPECDEAEVNIFLEVINPALFTYAGINILIPNPEWTYKTWEPYLPQFTAIWCKTQHAVEIFNKYNTNVRYIGWSSISKGISPKKNFGKALVVAGKNIFRHPKIIVDAYSNLKDLSKLPELHIVYDQTRMNVVVPPELDSKIKLYPSTLKQKEYDALVEECGLTICISAAEGFGHAVNEAASSGSLLMLSDIPAFAEFPYEAIWVSPNKEVPSDRFDTLYAFRCADVIQAFDDYVGISYKEKKRISRANADQYIVRHNAWLEMMKRVMGELKSSVSHYSLEDTATPEEELPGVTIVTPTKDRPYFMELCAGCVDSQCYPRDKLEWIVLDDGKDTCEDRIKHIPFAKHVLVTPGKSVAYKRNLGAKLAKFPVIVHFDDDDVYPPNSILFRVSMLLRGNKGAVFCSTLPSYDIANYISFVNIPPMHLTQAERVSEATMAYTREFWEEKGFDEEIRIAEGDAFIRGREQRCREISPQEVIVSLVHPRTTSSRRAPSGMEPNGCHFGFTEDLFKMVSTIGESLKKKEV